MTPRSQTAAKTRLNLVFPQTRWAKMMLLPLAIALCGISLMIGDALRAWNRILVYCHRAGLEVKSLKLTFGYWGGLFSPFRGKHIFRGILKKPEISEAFPAWFSSAGLICKTSDEPVEVSFSR